MVQGVKQSLRKTIGCTNLLFKELRTLLVEVEAVINSRPLTYVQEEKRGVNYVLTPSHLMYGRNIVNLPNSCKFEIESTYQTLTKRLKAHRHLLNQLLTIWRKDYLMNLGESHAVRQKQMKGPLIAVGDVVVLKDDMTKRQFWKLGLVEELFPGKDGQVELPM